MNPIQKHGVDQLKKAVKETDNKLKGITGDTENIKKQLQIIMDAVEHPVPNRVIDDE